MKTTKHWLHILLVVLTGGFWLPGYVVCVATTEMYNRGYRVGKAAGRVERQNEIDETYDLTLKNDGIRESFSKSFTDTKDRRVMKPLVDWPERGSAEPYVTGLMDKIHAMEATERTQSRVDRFAELCDMRRAGGLWSIELDAEYTALKAELSQ